VLPIALVTNELVTSLRLLLYVIVCGLPAVADEYQPSAVQTFENSGALVVVVVVDVVVVVVFPPHPPKSFTT